MTANHIIITGAREHNLKNITVEIPRNALTVITGLSGSGKSSLAFDTLYAEGQRKYVESLSAYARQFLEQMQKPDVDSIEGLSPAISIEQRTAGSNPRSIVATTTEIHDYLRLLYASVGKAHCWQCGRPVERQSAEEIVERLLAAPEGSRLALLAPVVRGRKGSHAEALQALRKRGFVRVRVDGVLRDLDEKFPMDARRKHTIEAVVDRLVLSGQARSRLNDSVETALREGEGILVALLSPKDGEGETETLHSERKACLSCGLSFEELTPRHFSFNSPYGACPRCHGLGSMEVFDEERVVPDPDLSLEQGAVHAWRRGGRRLILYYKHLLRAVAAHAGIDMTVSYRDLPVSFHRMLMQGSGSEEIASGYWRGGAYRRRAKPFEGVLPNLERRYRETESEDVRQRLRQYMSRLPCDACGGARLRPEILACTIGELSIQALCALSVREAAAFFDRLKLDPQEQKISRELLKEIVRRLQFLVDVGLDYLTLDRESGSLSGGEAQRIRLATQVGAGLVGVLYVLDEPSIGLHARDHKRLIESLLGLRDLGNTVVVVEHDEQTILAADHVIDLGPAAGRHGGELVFAGPPDRLVREATSLTAQYLRKETSIPVPSRRAAPGEAWLEVRGAAENNLRKIDVRIPLGLLVCVTGVSGSGKSSLVDKIMRRALMRHFYGSREIPGRHDGLRGLEHLDKVIVIDQAPIGRTPRSNPATYTGIFTLIRDLFARLPESRLRGYGPGRFSFNVKGGRCESCKGDGMRRIEMHFLPDVYVTCEACGGGRYNRETLEVRYGGLTIAEVLALTVDEALDFFSAVPRMARMLRTLAEVGLGYLQLGQSATTLSGGEAQRLKLSSELGRKATGRTLYLLDEPTTGLHFADVHRLLDVLLRLRDAGNTLVVIEHHLDVIKCADHVIDLGPEGGAGGGRIVVEGPPESLVSCRRSYTGRFLRACLQRAASGAATPENA